MPLSHYQTKEKAATASLSDDKWQEQLRVVHDVQRDSPGAIEESARVPQISASCAIQLGLDDLAVAEARDIHLALLRVERNCNWLAE